jgi:hypothetical protein
MPRPPQTESRSTPSCRAAVSTGVPSGHAPALARGGEDALESGRPGFAAINGAVLGFIAYGTYELTSWSVMRDWHPRMVALDWAWGTVVTGLAAWGGVVLALMLV